MLSSSSLGMTNNSGLLCSNTVSTVARQDFERATSSTETLPGTARPSRKAQAASRTVRETARVVEPGVMASPQCLSTIRKKILEVFLTPFDFSSFTTIRSFFFHSRHQVILKCRCCFPESEKMRQRRRQWRRRRRRRWRRNFSQMSFNEVTKKSSASFFHTMKKLEKSRKKISRQFLDHCCCKNISCWSSNLVGLP